MRFSLVELFFVNRFILETSLAQKLRRRFNRWLIKTYSNLWVPLRRLNRVQTSANWPVWSLACFQFRGYKESSHSSKLNEKMESFEHMLASPVYF